MTIEEAIIHCEEVAEEHTKYNFYGGYESCDECAKEHRQLAKWLEELKSLRSMRDSIVKIINENNAPAAWKYDMIVDEVMEHENFGCGED